MCSTWRRYFKLQIVLQLTGDTATLFVGSRRPPGCRGVEVRPDAVRGLRRAEGLHLRGVGGLEPLLADVRRRPEDRGAPGSPPATRCVVASWDALDGSHTLSMLKLCPRR